MPLIIFLKNCNHSVHRLPVGTSYPRLVYELLFVEQFHKNYFIDIYHVIY